MIPFSHPTAVPPCRSDWSEMSVTTAVSPGKQEGGIEPSPAVELRGVTKKFGDAVAVAGLDLQLGDSEFFALLGPSGCGKTTTLRMVGGFELPTTGQVILNGKDVTTLPPYRRDVTTVFQSYALFPHLSVFDNVAFGLRRRGIRSAEIRTRVGHDLEMVGLAGYGKRRPSQLSGGQQQRVALARALVNQPKLLLLDEPMGALDAKIRKSMQLELKRIQREVGITFLYVTHDQAEAMSMADRLAVMNAGRCEDIGAPDRVYEHPATRFVAEFFGTCNVLPVTAKGAGLALPDGTWVEVKAADTAQVQDGRAQVGIRPEKLAISRRSHETMAAPNSLSGVVTSAVYLGASTEYEVETTWGGIIRLQAQNLSENTLARVGDDVTMTWAPENSFLLPAEREKVS